jgi:hypothetical protein
METKILIQEFIMLRTVVGFLGEKPQFGWWDTNFLNKTSLQFLEINFPRSYLSAGCVSVTQAAQRVHDQFIGKNGVFHLFRLSQTEEQTLHEHLLRTDASGIIPLIQDKESGLTQLRKFFKETVDAPSGPVQVGTIKKIFTGVGIEEMAKHYFDAFTKVKKTYPYFRGQ